MPLSVQGLCEAEITTPAAYFRDRKEKRSRVLIPDSAHGTNPASAAIAGFDAVSVKSTEKGVVDLADLKAKLDERTAVFMITNPNTLGLFDTQIVEITKGGAAVTVDALGSQETTLPALHALAKAGRHVQPGLTGPSESVNDAAADRPCRLQ